MKKVEIPMMKRLVVVCALMIGVVFPNQPRALSFLAAAVFACSGVQGDEPSPDKPSLTPVTGPVVTLTDGATHIQKPPETIRPAWVIYPPAKYLRIDPYNVHLLGSATVSDWMMRESYNLIYNMLGALKNPEDRAKFSGHKAHLITNADPPLPRTKSQRNGGGKGVSLFDEDIVCTEAGDTMYPDRKPVYRGWDTPVHEFGHSIEYALGLQSRSDTVFSEHVKNYDPKLAREYFAWSVGEWFESTRNAKGRKAMPDWQYDYLSTIFSAKNKWKPDNSPRERGKDNRQKKTGEPPGPAAKTATTTPTEAAPMRMEGFSSSVAALPAEQQVTAVMAKLKELNPRFDGKEAHKIEAGALTELSFSTVGVVGVNSRLLTN
ncbi:MAG: hypothetical protein NTY01_04945 [Verrucomicrobia bacterium]|nr:hypothetical protein [Verrucomicrobiota bacterium]